MSHLRALASRVAGFVRNLAVAGADADARAEMEAHIEIETAENVRRGMAPAEARRQAHLAAGGLTAAVESVREARGIPWAEAVATDLRHAARSLRSQPSFSLAVIATLALGIGATVAMFTILNAVILRPLPYPEPERILSLSVASKGEDAGVVDDRSYEEWARASRTLEAIAVYSGGTSVVRTASGPQEVRVLPATASYFQVLGVPPLMGRAFTETETQDQAPVMLMSEQLWRGQFSADSAILGRTVDVDGTPRTIIGVMPAHFTTPRRAQLWRPQAPRAATGNMTFYHSVIARARHGVTVEAVRAELEAIQQRIEPNRTEQQRGLTPVVMTLHERRYGDTRRPLFLLFAAVAVLLLITCANLANLSLARAARRQREFALRVALGARRWRLARYVLTETMLLSLAGAAVGLALATGSVGYFTRISPAAVGNAEGIGVNGTVVLFTILLAVITSILFGLMPAFVAGRTSLGPALSAATSRASGSRRQGLLRRSLVVLELATALVLVVGAGLVARTFWTVTSIPTGFNAGGLLTARLQLPWTTYTDTTAQRFMEEVLRRLRAEPGVLSAALMDAPPLTGARMTVLHSEEGKPGARFAVVGATPGYFETMGTRIAEGRALTDDDRADHPRVAVVSDALARRFFPGRSAIGEQLTIGSEPVTIVGVCENVRQQQLEGDAPFVAFVPLAQAGGWRYLSLAVRATGEMTPLTQSVTRIVQELDPGLAPPPFRTMEEIFAEEVAPRKFILVLLGLFAALAALLAAVGLYGVLAYLVAEQTREIGIRAALGADRARVLGYMMGQGAALTAAGLALGLVAGALAVRLLQVFVYDMSVHDAATFAASSGILGVVAMLASSIPAWRASRVDPVIALRAE